MTDIADNKTPEEILQMMRDTPAELIRIPPKPIVVIYLPRHYDVFKSIDPGELMAILNGNFGGDDNLVKIKVTKYWMDYYWFCFYKDEIDEPEFQVFYQKDQQPISNDELKKLIQDATKIPDIFQPGK